MVWCSLGILIIVEMKVLFLVYLRDLSKPCDENIRISFQTHIKLFPSTVLAHNFHELWFYQLAKHIKPFGLALRPTTYHGFFSWNLFFYQSDVARYDHSPFFEAMVGTDDLLLIIMVSCTILSNIYNDVWINCMMKKRDAIQD